VVTHRRRRDALFFDPERRFSPVARSFINLVAVEKGVPRRTRVTERATSSALGSLLMVGVVAVLGATLAAGVLAMSDLEAVARQAENVLRCGRANC